MPVITPALQKLTAAGFSTGSKLSRRDGQAAVPFMKFSW
jgi:hypothetical protein